MTDTPPIQPRHRGEGVLGIDLGTSSVKVVIADLAANVGAHVRRKGERPEPREVLRAGTSTTGGEAARERDTVDGRAELARTERAVGEVDDGSEIDVHADAA